MTDLAPVSLPVRGGRTALLPPDVAAFFLEHGYPLHTGAGNRGARKYIMTYIAGEPLYVHRIVMGVTGSAFADVEVHHLNGPDDNRRESLQLMTAAEHASLSARWSKPRGISRFKGVCWNKKARKWRAQIASAEGTTCLGDFTTEEAAALCRDAASLARWGRDAWINCVEFPELLPPECQPEELLV